MKYMWAVEFLYTGGIFMAHCVIFFPETAARIYDPAGDMRSAHPSIVGQTWCTECSATNGFVLKICWSKPTQCTRRIKDEEGCLEVIVNSLYSPDLTPTDFYLSPFLSVTVYRNPRVIWLQQVVNSPRPRRPDLHRHTKSVPESRPTSK